MITYFSIPAPFEGETNKRQRVAINSWKNTDKNCEIILFGNESGTINAAHDLGVNHVFDIPRNKYGTPLVNHAFKIAQGQSKYRTLCYVNADIILPQDFFSRFERLDVKDYIMSGRRHDMDAEGNLTLHGWAAMDYFVFPYHITFTMPDMAVGRPGWDSWMVAYARSKGYEFIDATNVITVIHQNHPPRYHRLSAESQENCDAAGGESSLMTLREATLILGMRGRTRRPRGIRGIYYLLSGAEIVREMIKIKRRWRG